MKPTPHSEPLAAGQIPAISMTTTTAHHSSTLTTVSHSVEHQRRTTHLCITIRGGRGLAPAWPDARPLLILKSAVMLIFGGWL